MRASKTVNGVTTTYQYLGSQLIYENRNGADIYYYYDSFGTPTAIRYYEADGTSHRFFLATNQQGDIIGIYNANGNMVVKYEYDAWGNIISTTDANGGTLNSLSQKWSDINPFRYRSYYYDAETGLYYLNSRYYDPEVGRFLNADSVDYIGYSDSVISYNVFAYCENNAVVYIDPFGNNMISEYIKSIAESNTFKAALRLKKATELYKKHNISTIHLRQHFVDVKSEIYFQVPASNEIVEMVTITSYGYKDYDELTSGFYQEKYETIYFTGSKNAWSIYHSVSVSSREENYSLSGLVLDVVSSIFAVVSLFNPNSAFFTLLGALDASLGAVGTINDSLSWFEKASVSKFDKFVLDKIIYEQGDDITFLFSVIDRTVVYANEKREVIYKAYK